MLFLVVDEVLKIFKLLGLGDKSDSFSQRCRSDVGKQQLDYPVSSGQITFKNQDQVGFSWITVDFLRVPY